jgi:hypothetical protein
VITRDDLHRLLMARQYAEEFLVQAGKRATVSVDDTEYRAAVNVFLEADKAYTDAADEYSEQEKAHAE